MRDLVRSRTPSRIARCRAIGVLFGALMLSGCIAVHDQTTDPYDRMAAIATRFNAGFETGGMTAVIMDTQKCYRKNLFPIDLINSLRDCMVLDYTGYRMDIALGQKLLHGPPLPYFERQKFEARMQHYGHYAGLDNPERRTSYLETAYFLVSTDLARLTQQDLSVR